MKAARIEMGGRGLGETDNNDLEMRARQIAHSDGRMEANESDRTEALREMTDPLGDPEGPEDYLTEEERPDAGVAPSAAGRQAERLLPEDEANAADELVREGIEEADFNTRVRAGEHR